MARQDADPQDWNPHHVPCPCGCGELSDECAGPRPNPLGSMVVHDGQVRRHAPKRTGTTRRVEVLHLPGHAERQAEMDAERRVMLEDQERLYALEQERRRGTGDTTPPSV